MDLQIAFLLTIQLLHGKNEEQVLCDKKRITANNGSQNREGKEIGK